MLDVNNGYNLNLAKHVLAETASCETLWLEEPFYEDDVRSRGLPLSRRDPTFYLCRVGRCFPSSV